MNDKMANIKKELFKASIVEKLCEKDLYRSSEINSIGSEGSDVMAAITQ
jgi:hypothetical protein